MTDMSQSWQICSPTWAAPTHDQTAKTRVLQSHLTSFKHLVARHISIQTKVQTLNLIWWSNFVTFMTWCLKKLRYPIPPNGRAERVNQTLLNMFCTPEAEKQHRWPEHLPELFQAYNNTVHSAAGFTPSYLMFGHHLRLPEDVRLGVVDVRPTSDLGSWVPDHDQKLHWRASI